MESRKGMEYSFIKLVLVLFIVLLLMLAAYKFYWQPAKSTSENAAKDIEQQWQTAEDNANKLTTSAVMEVNAST